ncbi:MAG: hypothetical protein L0H83_10185 [Salinisphaera sp.]|nr:hypothetical protein [Salinisphaera sp.]
MRDVTYNNGKSVRLAKLLGCFRELRLGAAVDDHVSPALEELLCDDITKAA